VDATKNMIYIMNFFKLSFFAHPYPVFWMTLWIIGENNFLDKDAPESQSDASPADAAGEHLIK
jgi:hypothetical protein